MSLSVMLPFSDVKASTMNMSPEDLVTVTPSFCTDSGRLDWASCSLFCTCICATSGSVPEAKVSSISELPSDELLDDMYSRLSMPVMACSITWVTEFSVVSAEAP